MLKSALRSIGICSADPIGHCVGLCVVDSQGARSRSVELVFRGTRPPGDVKLDVERHAALSDHVMHSAMAGKHDTCTQEVDGAGGAFRMLRLFLGSWIIYWVLLAITPVVVIYPHAELALLIQMTFVAFVAIGYIITLLMFRLDRLPTVSEGGLVHARSIVNLGLVLSVAGLAALVYDKVAIQGIDYSQGLAFAREQWRRLGEGREGVSSLYSLIGYAIGSSYFVSLIVVFANYKKFKDTYIIFVVGISFCIAAGASILSGGRSILILLIVFILCSTVVRRDSGILRAFPRFIHRTFFVVIGIFCFSYALYVTYSRSEASGTTLVFYVKDFLPYLGLDLEPSYYAQVSDGPISAISLLVIHAVSYLIHSFATMAAIVEVPQSNSNMLFVHWQGLIAKLLGGHPPDADWALTGRFPSLPGILWLQYRVAGLVVGGLILGIATGLSRAWTTAQKNLLFPLGIYTAMGSILLLSPLAFAPDLYVFPFVMLALLILSVWEWLQERRSSKGVPVPISSLE